MSSNSLKKAQTNVSSTSSTSSKSAKTWKEKLLDLVGQKCCWRPNVTCCEECKNVWRCWIGLASFYTLIFSAFEFGLMIHIFLPYSDNPGIFVGDKMKKLFMLSDRMFPIWLLMITIATFFMSLWSLIFSLQPDKADSKSLIAVLDEINSYRIISSFVVISVLILSIVQVVLYIIEWPDEKYKRELERIMRNDMEFGRPPDLIRKSWVDTQDTFQCCGIYSWNDWFNLVQARNITNSHNGHHHHLSQALADKELPLSCCIDQVEFCFESNAWKIGCLEEQISVMKTYSLFNTIFTYILYFLVDWMSRSVEKFFLKFPAPPPDSADEENSSDPAHPFLDITQIDPKTKPISEVVENENRKLRKKEASEFLREREPPGRNYPSNTSKSLQRPTQQSTTNQNRPVSSPQSNMRLGNPKANLTPKLSYTISSKQSTKLATASRKSSRETILKQQLIDSNLDGTTTGNSTDNYEDEARMILPPPKKWPSANHI